MTKLKKAMSIALVALMLMSALPMQLFAATMNDPWASTNVNDNIFLDALKYTGYDTSYFINNGTFGSSVPNSALSGIGYSSPGASGLEKTSAGKPDLAAFKSKGMCCASYASYVYFNYLPNVKGYNMTDLAVPSNPHSPDSWHTACEKWVSSGNATKTTINGSTNPNASTNSNLSKLKNVAIGSILTFTDSDGYAHIGLYAGYKNGRYYQTQVGNSRGPEVNVIDNFQKNGYLVVEAAYTPNVTEPDYYGAVGVKKVDDAGNAVSGAKIGVYSDSSCTKLVTTLTTGSNGTATYGYSNGEYTLDEGTTYYFKETSAPTGYDLSTQIVSAKVVKEKVTYASTSIVDNRQGKITLTKYDDANTKLGSGYVFGIYSDKACTKQITTMTTNSNGVATSGWLSAGTYYVKETSIPSSDKTHKLNTTVYTVTVTKGGTTAVNSGKFVNDRMKGNATVTKTSEDGIVEGLTFRLYGTADIGTAVDMTAKTNSKGVATFSNV
ncbi:MAG: hypothetical protein J1F23_07810, partial [Oscillospiraceae bacterium]|nr:hypothetical protein [Oscillospiraceae bacterium]